MKTTSLPLKHSMNREPNQLAFLLVSLVLVCFAVSPQARAVCQEGCDLSNFSTFLGDNALVNNTGASNTAVGAGALTGNTAGSQNTAIGVDALSTNTTGIGNTASGFFALRSNTDGNQNTAIGENALSGNTTGNRNTATGEGALGGNRSGQGNTATGSLALSDNTTGNNNTAAGFAALLDNTIGGSNTAMGRDALGRNTTGNNNVAVGASAGLALTTGSNNIEIGNHGLAGESDTIRIGKAEIQSATFIAGISGATVPAGVAVIVDSSGHLGTTTSSARFKEAIKPMDKASEAILALKPVTFCYKQELDPAGIPQFGLVAEDVEKVNRDLVVRSADGKPYTVRYDAVNAMLLNEFLKEHRKNEEQQAIIERQQKQIEVLTMGLQKVSAQIEASQTAPQVVSNNP